MDLVPLPSPSPDTAHQLIIWNLVNILGPYLQAHPVGTALAAPFDIKLSPFTVLVPDIVYFTAERFARAVNEKHATAAPDARSITALRRPRAGASLTDVTSLDAASDGVLESPLFPGLEIHLRDVFRSR